MCERVLRIRPTGGKDDRGLPLASGECLHRTVHRRGSPERPDRCANDDEIGCRDIDCFRYHRIRLALHRPVAPLRVGGDGRIGMFGRHLNEFSPTSRLYLLCNAPGHPGIGVVDDFRGHGSHLFMHGNRRPHRPDGKHRRVTPLFHGGDISRPDDNAIVGRGRPTGERPVGWEPSPQKHSNICPDAIMQNIYGNRR